MHAASLNLKYRPGKHLASSRVLSLFSSIEARHVPWPLSLMVERRFHGPGAPSMHGLRQSAMLFEPSISVLAIASSRTSHKTLGEGFQTFDIRAPQTVQRSVVPCAFMRAIV